MKSQRFTPRFVPIGSTVRMNKPIYRFPPEQEPHLFVPDGAIALVQGEVTKGLYRLTFEEHPAANGLVIGSHAFDVIDEGEAVE